MEDFEPIETIGAIAVVLGGRDSSTEFDGNDIELGSTELDSKLPSATVWSVVPGLGIFWECLEQAPTSKIKGLDNSGPESLPTQYPWASEGPWSITLRIP